MFMKRIIALIALGGLTAFGQTAPSPTSETDRATLQATLKRLAELTEQNEGLRKKVLALEQSPAKPETNVASTATAAAAASATTTPPTAALTASFAVPVLSAYVWRGIVVNDGPVAQPNATISKNGFSFNVWGNYNFTDAYSDETKQEVSEVDFTLSYSRTVGPVTLGAAYAEYVYPHQTVTGPDGRSFAAPGTREVQVSAGLPDVFLTPTLTLVRDIDEIDGSYASFALSKSFTLSKKVQAAFGFSTGAGDKDYNAGYFGVSKTQLVDGNLSFSLPIAITDTVTLTPLVQYTWLWDSQIRGGAETLYKDDSAVWGGVTLNVSL